MKHVHAQATWRIGDTQFEAFKTFLVDQLKVLMEGLMDPALVQETLDYQKMNRRAMASMDKASRQVALVVNAVLMWCLVTKHLSSSSDSALSARCK